MKRLITLLLAIIISICTISIIASVSPTSKTSFSVDPAAHNAPTYGVENLVSNLPHEGYDPVSGDLTLHYVDINLPGNGTLPIQIIRRYDPLSERNTQCIAVVGMLLGNLDKYSCRGAWYIGPNVPIISADDNWQGILLAFTVRLPNGQNIRMYPNSHSNTNRFVSSNNWQADVNHLNSVDITITLTSPQGIKYYYHAKFGLFLHPYQSHRDESFEPYHIQLTKVTDLHGNSIIFEYKWYNTFSYLHKITASDGREVDFKYRADMAKNLMVMEVSTNGQTNGQTWKYPYIIYCRDIPYGADHCVGLDFRFRQAIRPDGKLWNYRYDQHIIHSQHLRYTLRDSLSPSHLLTKYSYVDYDGSAPGVLPYSKDITEPSVLAQKTISSPNIQTQTWAYSYSIGSNDGTTTITGPHKQVTFHYIIPAYGQDQRNQYNYAVWEYGLVDSIGTYAKNGQLLRADTFNFTPRIIFTGKFADNWLAITDHGDGQHLATQYAVPKKTLHKIVIPDVGTYITHYSKYDQYGRPGHIEEIGDDNKKRKTDLTYYTNPGKFIIGGIKTKTVDGTLAVENAYNDFGELTSHKLFGVPTTYTYNNEGNLATITDANQHATTFSDYYRGQAKIVQYADGTTSTKKINPTGTVQSQTDANQHTTKYTYDDLNRVKTITDPKNNVTTITYDEAESGPGGNTVVKGHLKTINKVNALNQEIEVDKIDLSTGSIIKNAKSYDNGNRLAFQTYTFDGHTGNPTLGKYYQYDALGRITQEHFPTKTGHQKSYEYLLGHHIKTNDARGFATTTTYQSYGNPSDANLIQIDQPEGITTKIGRDVFGHIKSVAQDKLTRVYDYYPNFFLKSINNPEIDLTSFGRDAVGNMSTKTIGKLVTTYHYDKLNRLKEADYSDSTPSTIKTYYPGGKLKTLSKGNIHQDYVYDVNDNLTDENIKIGTKLFNLHYDYDDLNHLIDIVYPDKKLISYTSDAFGDVTKVGDCVNSIHYYANGIIQSMQYGNGVTATTSLNARLLPETLVFKKDPIDIERTYQYDDNDNISSITDKEDPSYNLTLDYDGVNRLKTANGKWGNGSIHYTVNGDIDEMDLGSASLIYTLDEHDLLKSVSGAAVRDFNYDALGNVINNGKNIFNYTLDGNLTQVKNQSGKVLDSYQYDGNGQRLVANDNVYSIYNQAGTLLFEKNENAGWSKDYVYLNSQKVVQLETTKDNSKITYFHNNLLGSPIAATDINGNKLWEQHYQPYGERLNKTIGADNPQWYTGKVEDKDDGLMYYGARYFDPVIGRFMAMDPVGFNAKKPMTFNRYAYAADNPYFYIDPTGMDYSAAQAWEDTSSYVSNVGSGINDGMAFGFTHSSYSNVGLYSEGFAVGYGINFAGGWMASLGVKTFEGAEFAYQSISRLLFRRSADEIGTKSLENSAPKIGQKVYRVWGDGAKPNGRSWTRTDPSTIPNYRNEAGLPNQNSARFISEGRLTDINGVSERSALPLHGNLGGLDELLVPNPNEQIEIGNVSGINPGY